ncbi:hypothetical protein Hanom_Chr15g01361701 [Helianthus anomalus]
MKNWNRSKYLGTWVRVGLGIFSVRFSVIFGPDLNLLTPNQNHSFQGGSNQNNKRTSNKCMQRL